MSIHVAWNTDASPPEPRLYNIRASATTAAQITAPTGVFGINILPAFARVGDRMYLAGTFSDILVYNEYEELKVAGIPAPGVGASITASGTGSLTGLMTPYITFVDKADDGTVLAESNPAIGDEVEFSGAGSRVWADIPSSGSERVTHVRGYVSVAGFLPRLVWERTIGTTSVTESMTTAFLSQQPGLPNDGAASPNVLFNRIPPPYCKYIAWYHRRMFYAGDPQHPARVWYSELDEPESVGADSFFDVRDGEEITGLFIHNEDLMVGCVRAFYQVTGYSDGQDGVAPDLEPRKIVTGIGLVSHQSAVDINDRTWFLSEDGVRIYDGGFRYISTDVYSDFRSLFANSLYNLKRAQAVDDKDYQNYILLVPDSAAPLLYVGHYRDTDPATGGNGGEPYWSIDTMERGLASISSTYLPSGRQQVLLGGCDGYVRYYDDTDADDDGDSDAKITQIRTPQRFWNGITADKSEGVKVLEVHSYMEWPGLTPVLNIWCGDESAEDQLNPSDTETLPTPSTSHSYGGSTYTHVRLGYHKRVAQNTATGRTAAIEWIVTSGTPSTFKWRGYGLRVGPGRASRGYSAVS